MLIPKQKPCDDFSPWRFKKGVSAIIGPSGCGKSVLCYNILKNIDLGKGKKKKAIIYFCSTDDDLFLVDYIMRRKHPFFPYKDFKNLPDVIEQVKSLGQENGCVIIIDDMNENLTPKAKETIGKFFTVARHYRCEVLFLTQYYTCIPACCRAQIENFYLFNGISQHYLDDIWTVMFGISKKRFREIYANATFNASNSEKNFLYVCKSEGLYLKNIKEKYFP